MRNINPITFIPFLIPGIFIGKLQVIYTHLYGLHWIDIFLLVVASIAGIWLRHVMKVFKLEQTSLILAILLASLGDHFIYYLYNFTDYISQLALFSCFLVGFLSHSKSKGKPLYWPLTPLAIGVGYGASYIPVLWILVLVLLVFLVGKHSHPLWVWSKVIGLAVLLFFFSEIDIPESQNKYVDKVVFSKATSFQNLDITRWNGHYWFYQNSKNQLSSIDYWLYYEPLVHPVMNVIGGAQDILVIGGENGIIVKELAPYDFKQCTLLPLDTALLRYSNENQLFTQLNEGSLKDPRVNIRYKKDILDFLHHNNNRYDVVIVDVPDPTDIELNQFYTLAFYEGCFTALKKEGAMVTQSGSPYFAGSAFDIINNTCKKSGFTTTQYHNQVLTLGEWGWTLGIKSHNKKEAQLVLQSINFDDVPTKWLNNQAMDMMLSFGKPWHKKDSTSINTLQKPIVYQHYLKGSYAF